MKKFIFLIAFIAVILFFGRNLNPFSDTVFTFHDETQPARIQQFVTELRNLHIPPRLAPDFSFKMGYPVFNFYAPSSYWITSAFSLVGFDTVNALKLSFLLSILVGFIAAYLFLKEYFDFFPSLTGAVLYISSLYYPLDIFVRGNLGEVWFLALFPLALYFVERNSKKPNSFLFFFLTISLSFLFTVHNLLSAVSVLLVFGFILIHPHKKINLLAMIFALLLSSYFLLPMMLENNLTYASYVATLTKYWDHFVCPSQLWQSAWGFGGSTKGCVDGMSFKIGKLQLIFAFMGMILFIFMSFQSRIAVRDKLRRESRFFSNWIPDQVRNDKRIKTYFIPYSLFFILLTLGSLFMSTYLSKPLWDALSPILSLFQFPWRFIAFSLVGIAFFAAFFLDAITFKFKNIFLVFLILFLIINYSKYFSGQSVSKQRFEKTYLSKEYIEQKVAYKIAEYLPRTANYSIWRTYEKTPPKKAMINIHYFPFWKIFIDGKTYVPTKFDELGRPMIDSKKDSNIQILYKETPIEKLGNFITILSFGILLYTVKSRKLWNRLRG
jgi:hypothetical protein